MRLRAALLVWLLAGVCLAGHPPPATTLVALLDRYAAGDFQRVVEHLAGEVDFKAILDELRRDGPRWIEAAGDENLRPSGARLAAPPRLTRRERRELVAATFALEAARAGLPYHWKHIQRQPRMSVEGVSGGYQPPSMLYWDPPPLLIEWACGRLRGLTSPHPLERLWQLAALSVAQRSEDAQFLIGDTNLGRGLGTEEIGNTSAEIKHLDHVTPRFPHEMRFVLAQGIARDRVWPEDAIQVYRALERHPDVGGEALMRHGAMRMRRDARAALELFDEAVTQTRDPYVVFLAQYFSGRMYEQAKEKDDAEAAYRRAVASVPHAQSATLALAALISRDGRRSEARRLVEDMLAASPRPPDPWRGFVRADDRFWPQLVARLRAEIVR